MAASRLSTARFTAALVDASIVPRIIPARPPLVFCHWFGSQFDATCAVGGNSSPLTPNLATVLRAVADDGWPVVVPTLTNLWGSTTAMTRIDNAITYTRANYRATAAQPIFIGMSMGNSISLRYHKLHGATAAVGFIPAVDLQDIRTRDPGGLGVRASLDTAFGVTYPAALPAGVDPAANTADYTALPMQMWGASNDSTLLTVPLSTFCTATGATLISLGALDHTDAAIGAVNIATLLAFLTPFK